MPNTRQEHMGELFNLLRSECRAISQNTASLASS
jgi:hypothetical protein